MNWDDLRYILAVYKAGSIAAGAKTLQVNATTVSRRIKAIEESSGVRAFEKLRDGVVLTGPGEELVSTAEKIEELTHDLSAKIDGLDSQLRGTIRVTSIDALLTNWMWDFGNFQKDYPEINLELLSSYSLVNLSRREADIAIRMAAKAPPHLIGRKHAEVFFAVYGSNGIVDSIGENASYADYPWLSWDFSVGRVTDNYLEKHVKDAKIVLRVDRMDVMVQALERGMGITILPCFAGDRSKKLRRVGNYFEGGSYLWLLTHPDLKSTARVRAFNHFIKEVIKRDFELIEGRRPKRMD